VSQVLLNARAMTVGGRDYVHSTVRGITDEIDFNGTDGMMTDTRLDDRPTGGIRRSENLSHTENSKGAKRYPSSRTLDLGDVVV
jgi:hypothetical protein